MPDAVIMGGGGWGEAVTCLEGPHTHESLPAGARTARLIYWLGVG